MKNPHLRTFKSIIRCAMGLWLGAWLLQGGPAQAEAISETRFWKGKLTEDAALELLQGEPPAEWMLWLEDPENDDIARSEKFLNHSSLSIEMDRWIANHEVAAWKTIAPKIKRWIGLNTGVPTLKQADVFNTLGFRDLVFVLPFIPMAEGAKRLTALKANVRITFQLGRFPKFLEKESLLAIPSEIPLFFVSPFWPWYGAMDVFNMIPHQKSMRIEGAVPSAQNLEYMRHMKNLGNVGISTDFDVNASAWEKLKGFDLTWTVTNWMPSVRALEAFVATGVETGKTRKLVLVQNTPIEKRDRVRLEALPIPISWIREVK